MEMVPELKRAIMKYLPEYYSWDVARQEKIRVDMPKEMAFQIRRFLIGELLGILVATEDEMTEAETHFNGDQWSTINEAMLPLQGIGEDYFFLNESFEKGKSTLSYATLHDYDFDNFQFQEKCRMRDIEGYEGKPYYGSLFGTWARLLINGKFSYAFLDMMAGYIYCEVEDFGNEYTSKLIPSEFKPGKGHGEKDEDGYFFYNMKEDAGGLELQLQELNRRFRRQLQDTYERLEVEFSEKSRQQVFILDTSRDGVPGHHFIFTDEAVLPHIRPKTFLKDCRSAERKDHSILTGKIGEEKESMGQFLDEQCSDIMANFDTKIVKLRKKRKIRFHPDSGLADLFD